MASTNFHNRIGVAWSMAESGIRRVRGRTQEQIDEAQKELDVVSAIRLAANVKSDRELCRDFPEFMEQWLTVYEWERCKP